MGGGDAVRPERRNRTEKSMIGAGKFTKMWSAAQNQRFCDNFRCGIEGGDDHPSLKSLHPTFSVVIDVSR
jgi:hypothetical protein